MQRDRRGHSHDVIDLKCHPGGKRDLHSALHLPIQCHWLMEGPMPSLQGRRFPVRIPRTPLVRTRDLAGVRPRPTATKAFPKTSRKIPPVNQLGPIPSTRIAAWTNFFASSCTLPLSPDTKWQPSARRIAWEYSTVLIALDASVAISPAVRAREKTRTSSMSPTKPLATCPTIVWADVRTDVTGFVVSRATRRPAT